LKETPHFSCKACDAKRALISWTETRRREIQRKKREEREKKDRKRKRRKRRWWRRRRRHHKVWKTPYAIDLSPLRL